MTMKKRAKVKGECTLLVAGRKEKEEIDSEMVEAEIKAALKKHQSGLSEITKLIAQKYGLSKNEVYNLALKLKRQGS